MSEAFWKGRRVFVTGCNGFLGSWLTGALLRRGAVVTGLIHEALPDSRLARSGDQQRIDTVAGSVEHSGLLHDAFASRKIECVFHLAAQSQVGEAHRDPLPTLESNVRGSWILLCWRRHARTRACAAWCWPRATRPTARIRICRTRNTTPCGALIPTTCRRAAPI